MIEEMFDTISTKAEKFLNKITERLLNKEICPERLNWLRLSEKDLLKDPQKEEVRFAVYPVAADPLHWVHLIIPLILLADEKIKIDGVVVLIQGRDIRKERLAKTEKYRHTIVPRIYNNLFPFVKYSPLGFGNYDIGEVRLGRLLALNNHQRKIVYYVAGADHFNRYVERKRIKFYPIPLLG